MNRAIVVDPGGAPFLARRTVRSLRALGIHGEIVRDVRSLKALLRDGLRWIVRSGAFPRVAPSGLAPSATGRPVVAFGAPLAAPGPGLGESELTRTSRALLALTGGDHDDCDEIPFASLLVDDGAADVMSSLASWNALFSGLGRALAARRVRVVRLASLDAGYAEELRVAEIVTSFQIGGAEKIARDLAESLPRTGVSARLVGLGNATRARWAPLLGELDLGRTRLAPEARVARMVEELLDWGADVAHTHLFGSDVNDALSEAGFPVVITIHNAVQGFPEGTHALSRQSTALVVACAEAVERELHASGVEASTRTVRNGVSSRVYVPFDAARAAALRHRWDISDEAIVLLVVANPRPQKRLDRLAPVATALSSMTGRPVHVIWAGAPSRSDECALGIERSLVASLAEAGIPLKSLGAEPDLGHVLEASDVALSLSDWEGLSLAQLEAVRAGLPVVATRVGGAFEIAASTPLVTLVDRDALALDIAKAIAQVLEVEPRSRRALLATTPLPEGFCTRSMVRAYGRLLRRAAGAARPAEPRGLDLVLVTNNFSPGGAQSSARRLLVELARRGRRVLAVTIEEDPDHPTPGLRALSAAQIPMLVLPRVGAAEAASRAVDAIDGLGAKALVFWNAIAEHKVLLSETLYDVPSFDVSPGEMYFASLSRYFERPRADVACDSALAYGRRLSGVIVKFEEERALAAATCGAPVHVVPNGVPVTGFSERSLRARGSPPVPFRFGTSIRIHPHKKVEMLLSAFRDLVTTTPHVELQIAGAPDAGCADYLRELEALAAGLPVQWLGHLDDVSAFLSELDAFVLVAEPAGCPNASLEALGAGLPTIATDVGGIREQLGEGAGLIAPRDDPKALAELMRDVVTRPALRADLSQKALARARDRFSIGRMADEYERIFFGPPTSARG